MKALSLTQPWASLVAIGAKQWETRSWATSYRGPVAIHASKGYPRDCRELEFEEPFLAALKRGCASPHMLPLGSIIAIGDIGACEPTSRFMSQSRAAEHPAAVLAYLKPIIVSTDELHFGDYSEDRYAFRVDNVRLLPTPIPCKGALGFWSIPAEGMAQIQDQLNDLKHDAAVRAEARGELA